jgi:hypothetical protein
MSPCGGVSGGQYGGGFGADSGFAGSGLSGVYAEMAWRTFLKVLASDFFKFPVDELPLNQLGTMRGWLKDRFGELPWDGVYDLAEFLLLNISQISSGASKQQEALVKNLNLILEREMSAYRSIGGILTSICDGVEVEEIEKALAENSWNGVRSHIQAAVEMLGKRPVGDFRNSIKESISAVESACKVISGEENADLNRTLRKLEEKIKLHGALKQAIEKLYAWTSDEKGIRHALLDEPDVGESEARFMVVACSSIVNFLRVKAEQAETAIV